jgi:hypothetical protein
MGWVKLVVVLGCVWGNTAFASLPDAVGGERQELQTISSWMEYLNTYYPVQVRSRDGLDDQNVRHETLQELQLLEDVLQTGGILDKGTLMHIACGAVCGDEPPGKCVKCSTNQD